jgi:hypothetical protein
MRAGLYRLALREIGDSPLLSINLKKPVTFLPFSFLEE